MSTQTNEAVKSFSVSEFLKGVRSELKKVNWPNRKDLVKYTSVVVIMCAVMGAFIGAIDMVFHEGFSLLIK